MILLSISTKTEVELVREMVGRLESFKLCESYDPEGLMAGVFSEEFYGSLIFPCLYLLGLTGEEDDKGILSYEAVSRGIDILTARYDALLKRIPSDIVPSDTQVALLLPQNSETNMDGETAGKIFSILATYLQLTIAKDGCLFELGEQTARFEARLKSLNSSAHICSASLRQQYLELRTSRSDMPQALAKAWNNWPYRLRLGEVASTSTMDEISFYSEFFLNAD